jgi:hypothetical protein
MKPSRYLLAVVILVFIGVIAVAILSYTIDPAGIYHETDDSIYDFVSQLVVSKNGLVIESGAWNDRDISITLAEYPIDVSCYLIGSSHIRHLGSARKHKALVQNCPTLINLSVSGGTLEDYVALSGVVSRNTSQGKNIVFGIDPWSLNFRRDVRWLRYEDEYISMLKKIQNIKYNAQEFSLLTNLVNRDYFIRSINSIGFSKNKILHAPYFDQSVGFYKRVILPDGSYINSKQSKLEHAQLKITGVHDYKIINDHWYEESAVRLFVQLVTHLQKRFNVIFIMTPYHHSVWKNEEQAVFKALKIVEDKVREIAKTLKVEVYGSYNPVEIGCEPEEFYDEQHAGEKCMARLEN